MISTMILSVGALGVVLSIAGEVLGVLGAYCLASLFFLTWSCVIGLKVWTTSISGSIDYVELFNWIDIGNNFYVHFSLETDFNSLLVTQLILTGSFFVVLFATYDMYDDREALSFLANISYFVFFMLLLVNSSSLINFYLGWEGIGLESFVLVSFYSERVRSIKASIKIFFINKIGDLFLLVLLLLLWTNFASVDISLLNSTSDKFTYRITQFGNYTFFTHNLTALFLVFAASIKSAQFGFHIWLIEAMEAPMGASALMHSSTLVIAGVLLILKLHNFLISSLLALNVLIFLGTLTTFSATVVALTTVEIKSVLANSTISNMGYLFILLGYSALDSVYTVILIHGYIKIFLFIIAGLIIHHFSGNQDVRHMGSLVLYSPFLWFSYIAGAGCLMGLPLTSGYYCKLAVVASLSLSTFTYQEFSFFILILVSLFLSILYPSLLGYSIFLTAKQSHFSVYLLSRPVSPLVIALVYIMSFVIFFGGYTITILVMFDANLFENQSANSLSVSINDIWSRYFSNSSFSVLWAFSYLVVLNVLFTYVVYSYFTTTSDIYRLWWVAMVCWVLTTIYLLGVVGSTSLSIIYFVCFLGFIGSVAFC